jgi:elongation factor G
MCRQEVVASDVPSNMQDLVMEKRRELIEVVSEVDDQLAEAFLSDEPISADELKVYLTYAHYYYWLRLLKQMSACSYSC